MVRWVEIDSLVGMLKMLLWFLDLVTKKSEVKLMVIDQQTNKSRVGGMSLICDVEFQALALIKRFEAHDNVGQGTEIWKTSV